MSCPIEAIPCGAGSLDACSAGELAMQSLEAGGCGRTVARFANCVYVRFASGSFVCIGTRAIGAGPLNVLLAPSDWERLQPLALRAPAVGSAEALLFTSGFRVALTHATIWRPHAAVISSDVLERQLRMLTMVAPRLLPVAGLSRLAFAPPRGAGDEPLLHHARAGWSALERWIANCVHEPTAVRYPHSSMITLIGLGPGLTPSGDDVFCGVLLALESLGLDAARATLWSWLQVQLAERTSELSAAHLHAAALGQGHSALHAILACKASGYSALMADLARLGRVGHCSGWDALAGVVLVWRAYAARHAMRRAAHSAA